MAQADAAALPLVSSSSRVWPTITYEGVANWCEKAVFTLASHLTEPVCKTRELYWKLSIVDKLHPEADKTDLIAKKFFICLKIGGYALAAIFATLPGMALRFIGSHLQSRPFIYMKGEIEQDKALPPSRAFTLFSWNICCAPAGYSITDGNVTPWATEVEPGSCRLDRVADRILRQDADIFCGYELMDFHASLHLYERLKSHYPHFYINIGPQAVGPNSGLFVASKYAIDNPDFCRFTPDELYGRAKHAAKGVFSFDVKSDNRQFARIFTTHLNHSEIPLQPEDGERAARAAEMMRIVGLVNAVNDRCVVVTGDLNLEDDEYQRSPWSRSFTKGDRFAPPSYTWGGDQWCARLMNKMPSHALSLDHTMVKNDSAGMLETILVGTGYDQTEFRPRALSDHQGLFSTIALRA